MPFQSTIPLPISRLHDVLMWRESLDGPSSSHPSPNSSQKNPVGKASSIHPAGLVVDDPTSLNPQFNPPYVASSQTESSFGEDLDDSSVRCTSAL
jgi:hypothetical protein